MELLRLYIKVLKEGAEELDMLIEAISPLFHCDTNLHLLNFSLEDLPEEVARLQYSEEERKWRESLKEGDEVDALNKHPQYPVSAWAKATVQS
jgi:hypothetical protein